MRFPFEFSKNSGSYDFASPVINFTANAAIVVAGGLSLGAISYLALKALGFSKIAVTATTAVPVTIGVFAAVGTVIGLGFLVAIAIATAKALSRR